MNWRLPGGECPVFFMSVKSWLDSVRDDESCVFLIELEMHIAGCRP